jgi:hypothetical protein
MNFRATIGITAFSSMEKEQLKKTARNKLPDLKLYKGHVWCGTVHGDLILPTLNKDSSVNPALIEDGSDQLYPL